MRLVLLLAVTSLPAFAQPVVGALSAAGAWNGAFVTGTVFALIAAITWLLIDSDQQVKIRPA